MLIQEENNEVPKYNCDKLYIKVHITIDPPLTPLVEDIAPLVVESVII